MDINEYLGTIPANRKARFNSLLDYVKSLYPDAEISMKYKMPTFTLNDGWVSLGNQKSYISLYTCSAEHLAGFKKKHPQIKTGKGCINFRDKDDIPLNDLKPVIQSAIESNHHR